MGKSRKKTRFNITPDPCREQEQEVVGVLRVRKKRLESGPYGLYENRGHPNSLIIREGEGVIIFPKRNRRFEVKMYNCVSNKTLFEEEITLPPYKIGSYGYMNCSALYGEFTVNGKRGVFYCHSGDCSRALNLLQKVLEHYENFENLSFNYIPELDMFSGKLIEEKVFLENEFDAVLKNIKYKVKYNISEENNLQLENFHVIKI